MSYVKEAFKESILHHLRKTTSHAIPNVIRDDVSTFAKMFWLILYLVGLAGCFYCNLIFY